MDKNNQQLPPLDNLQPKDDLPLTGKSLADLQKPVNNTNPVVMSSANPQPLQNTTLNNDTASKPVVDENRATFTMNQMPPLPRSQPMLNDTANLNNVYSQPQPEVDRYREESVPQKEIVYKEKKSGGGCNPFSIFGNIRKLACTGCLLIIVAIIILIVTIIFRPPVTWEPLKTFLNGDIKLPVQQNIQKQDIKDDFNTQINTPGEQKIRVSEAAIDNLISEQIGAAENDLRVDIQKGIIKLYVNIEPNKDVPLWAIIDIKQDTEGNFTLDNVGFNRVSLPKDLIQQLSNAVFTAANLSRGNLSGEGFKSYIGNIIQLASPLTIEVQDIKFEEDFISIDYTL